MRDVEHGTYAMYQRETKAGVETCEPCRQAARDYTAAYRATHPKTRERESLYRRARGRALSRLAHRHQRDFADLFDDEITRLGTSPSLAVETPMPAAGEVTTP